MKPRSCLSRVSVDDLAQTRPRPVDATVLPEAERIVNDVRANGDVALRTYGVRFDGIDATQPLVLTRDALEQAWNELGESRRDLLRRTVARIERFAERQRDSWAPFSMPVDGGVAGQRITPVDRAGCYAPGGRYPLPSSVLMTTVSARVAGVPDITLATPNPGAVMCAAAFVGGASRVLVVGGAHAVSAMAYGTESIPSCDVVVGPGNAWVTAAKYLVSRDVGIDMLAGPSELVIVADQTANPDWIAADLLAQAEHDVAAWPVLITCDETLVEAVNDSLSSQLASLSTAAVAAVSLETGCALVLSDRQHIVRVCDELAPEHLQIMTDDASAYAASFHHYGSVFVGSRSAEVAGDYGLGPNHVLPTGGSARYAAGLSVFTFLKARTSLDLRSEMNEVWTDIVALAEIEGLAGHAEAARYRMRQGGSR